MNTLISLTESMKVIILKMYQSSIPVGTHQLKITRGCSIKIEKILKSFHWI